MDHGGPLPVLRGKFRAEPPPLGIHDDRDVYGNHPRGTQEGAHHGEKHPPHPPLGRRMGQRKGEDQSRQDHQKEVPQIDPDQKRDPKAHSHTQHPCKASGHTSRRKDVGREKDEKVQHCKKRHVVPEHLTGDKDDKDSPQERQPSVAQTPQSQMKNNQPRGRAEEKEEDPERRVAWTDDLENPDRGIKPEDIVAKKGIHDGPLPSHEPERIDPLDPAFRTGVDAAVVIVPVIEKSKEEECRRTPPPDPLINGR